MRRELFLAGPDAWAAGLLFAVLLVAAARSDIASRRIPNRLVGALVVLGLAAAMTVLREPVGLIGAVAGFGLAVALWLPFWFLRVLGAGDVKLAAAIGVWLGPAGVVEASVLAALAGGVLAAGVLARRGRLGPLAVSVALWAGALAGGRLTKPLARSSTDVLPYGVALAVGAVLAGWLPTTWLNR
jgi:prepilin peptidase CpaA